MDTVPSPYLNFIIHIKTIQLYSKIKIQVGDVGRWVEYWPSKVQGSGLESPYVYKLFFSIE